MPSVKPEVPALAEAIDARMAELGIAGPSALAKAAGVTVAGIRPLRQGRRKNYQSRLTGPVCRALGWTPDSIDRILRGEDPVPLEPPLAADVPVRLAVLEKLVDEALARLDVLADNQSELFQLAHRHEGRRAGDAGASDT